MANANKEQKAETKAAKMKAAAKGVVPYKHEPKEVDPDGTKAVSDVVVGVDKLPSGVIQSGFSIFNQPQKATDMDQTTNTPKLPEAQADKEAAAKAKIAAKQTKLDAAAKAATKAGDAEKHAAEVAARKAEREQKAGETKEAHEARVAELTAAGRTYTGSMIALADRVKQGMYVKGLTGQLRSSDELALALDAVPVKNVIQLAVLALGTFMPADEVAAIQTKYATLNVGQQSMNLRNRLRGAIKGGEITLDKVKELRDENGFATAEDEATKRAEAKAAKEEAAAAAKAAKEEAAAAAKAAKEAVAAQVAADKAAVAAAKAVPKVPLDAPKVAETA